MYHIGGNTYSVVLDHKNGWNYEVFRDRYSEVLERYDFIVGDWGYNQLRLKGFFKETNNKGSKDSSITLLHDYLNEYCNFGCAYFIIEKLASRKNAEDGDGSEGDGDKLYEAERPREYELKPRHQYQRKQQEPAEPRQRGGQDKSTAAVHAIGEGGRKSANQEGAGRRDGERDFRSGQKGQDNRRGQDGARSNRDHGGGGKPRGDGDSGRQRDFGGGKPRERENSSREGEGGRQREQDGRRRESQQESRHRDQPNRPNRDQHSGERKQQGQQNQGEKGKQHPPRSKQGGGAGGNSGGGEHQRNREKDREKRSDREKGRAEPLV